MYGYGSPFAQWVYQDETTGKRYFLESALYVFDKTLGATDDLRDLAQFFERDAEFIWLAMHGSQSGTYQVQFQAPDGRWINSSPLNNANIVGTAQFPVMLPAPVRVPKGGKIGINIKNTSGASNTVQLCFVGVRAYEAP